MWIHGTNMKKKQHSLFQTQSRNMHAHLFYLCSRQWLPLLIKNICLESQIFSNIHYFSKTWRSFIVFFILSKMGKLKGGIPGLNDRCPIIFHRNWISFSSKSACIRLVSESLTIDVYSTQPSFTDEQPDTPLLHPLIHYRSTLYK